MSLWRHLTYGLRVLLHRGLTRPVENKPGNLETHRCASPLLGSDVGDGLREGPPMSREILRIVLAFAVNMVGRGSEDACPLFFGSLAVALRIGHPHHYQVCYVRRHFTLCDDETSVTRPELNPVVADAQADSEAKRVAQPVRRCVDIRIREYGNNCAWWRGSV
jgi:hypothetical protein